MMLKTLRKLSQQNSVVKPSLAPFSDSRKNRKVEHQAQPIIAKKVESK